MIVTEGLDLGMEKVNEFPKDDLLSYVQAGDLRNLVAHSLEASFRSIRVKKSIHSAGIVTKESPGSLVEKYLAHIRRAAGLGMVVLTFSELAQSNLSTAKGSREEVCIACFPLTGLKREVRGSFSF